MRTSGQSVSSKIWPFRGKAAQCTQKEIKKKLNTIDLNILFVCTRNKCRSRTAESIFKNLDGYQIRSAGTSNQSVVRLTPKLISWADRIFVMEPHHKRRIFEMFPDVRETKEIIVLDIPDEFGYMDAELIDHLKDAIDFYL